MPEEEEDMWEKFDKIGTEDEEEIKEVSFVRAKQTINTSPITEDEDDDGVCGGVFIWKTSDDIPLQAMIEYAFHCKTDRVWRFKTMTPTEKWGITMAIIGAKTKGDAFNAYIEYIEDDNVDINEVRDEVWDKIIPWEPIKSSIF